MKKPIKTEENTPKAKPEAKPTHNISNGEELFLQEQHEARIENEDYLAAMEQSNFE